MPPADSDGPSLWSRHSRASGLSAPHLTVAGYGINLQGALLSSGAICVRASGLVLEIQRQTTLASKFFRLICLIRCLAAVAIVTLKNRTLRLPAMCFLLTLRESVKSHLPK